MSNFVVNIVHVDSLNLLGFGAVETVKAPLYKRDIHWDV